MPPAHDVASPAPAHPGGPPGDRTGARRTFVLVHGAWHGGWCWQAVARRLRYCGAEVYAPTLTGLGERRHLLTREVGLATHVADVVAVLEYEDLTDVTLVGHSYAGLVVTAVAEHAAERVTDVVYLDAFVPRAGESLFDQVDWAEQARAAAARGDGWRCPPPPSSAFGVTEPALAEHLTARLTPMPLRAFEEALVLDGRAAASAVRRRYVHCAANPDPNLAAAADRARHLGWPYTEVAVVHDAMLTEPEVVANALLE